MMFTCNIIEDLLPLYADGICSEDSRTAVEHHIAECPDCKKKLEAMRLEIKAPPEQSPKEENPFKKINRHYTRLVIVTLCICAAVLIPSAIFFRLYINGETNQGVTFTGLKIDSEIWKFGNMLKRGEYRKALESIDLYWQDGYTDEEISDFKDMFAEDLKSFFEKYPIRWILPHAGSGNSTYGDLVLHLKGDFGTGAEGMMALSFDVIESDDGTKRLCSIGYWGYVGHGDSEYAENSLELNALFPPIQLIPSNSSEYLLKGINAEESRSHMFLTFLTEETEAFSNEMSENGTYKFEEIGYVYRQKLKKLEEKYTFTGCKAGNVTYERGKLLYRENYFLQHTVLTVKANGGGEFTVEFDLPTFDGYSFTHFKNVTYSPNAPEDFKKQFEKIFVSEEAVYPQFVQPKLNDGKFYFNGDTESTYFEVKDGTIALRAETEKQLRDLYKSQPPVNRDYSRTTQKMYKI